MMNNNMNMNNMSMNSNFTSPPPQNNCNGGNPQNFTPSPSGSSGGYQSFKIGSVPDFRTNNNCNGGGMHVMTEQFGQGILLQHDLSTRNCLVQLARDCDGVNQIWIPGSQITLHTQHRVLSFEDFMREEMERAASDAANAGCGGNNSGFKRQRDVENNELHNSNFQAAANHQRQGRPGF